MAPKAMASQLGSRQWRTLGFFLVSLKKHWLRSPITPRFLINEAVDTKFPGRWQAPPRSCFPRTPTHPDLLKTGSGIAGGSCGALDERDSFFSFASRSFAGAELLREDQVDR